MRGNNDTIMSSQVFSITINVIIGLDILTLPNALAKSVGPDTPWVLFAGILLFLINLWIVQRIITMNPHQNIIQLGDNLVFRYFGSLIALIFLVYGIVQLSMQVRAFADIIKNFLLFNTPLEIIMITYIIVVVYVARSGIESLARMSAIILIFSLVPMVIAMCFAIPDLDMTTYLPLFRSSLPEIKSGLIHTFLSLRGFEFLLVYGHFIKDTENLQKNVMRSGYLIGLLYIFIVIVSTAKFGVIQTKYLLWPVLTLFKSFDFPGGLVENVEVIIMTTWVTSVFLSTGILLFSCSSLVALLTKSKEHNFWVIAFIPITIIIGLFPKNIAQVYDFSGKVSSIFGIVGTIIIPLILFIMSYRKKRRQKRNV